MQIETDNDAGLDAGLKHNENSEHFPRRSGSRTRIFHHGFHLVQRFIQTERQLFCPASVYGLCGLNNPLNLNRYRRQESLEGVRGRQYPHLRTSQDVQPFEHSGGCGFDPEQFVGASVTRGFYTKVLTLNSLPFYSSFGGSKRGAFGTFFPRY